ncbi:PilW family protein [Paucibacter soli]|uniref:PilW family protein n=1 Tax=Paucibacter soli TaxID=3133433 RepID=UPI0030993D44
MSCRHGLIRASAQRCQQGFTLLELMVGVLIGLLCTLVIATVLSAAEGQRRGTTEGGDALVSGQLALYALQRDVAIAGYGYASEASAVGCTLDARFNGAVTAALPPVLAPVIITAGGPGVSDQIRVVASSKLVQANGGANQIGYSVPMRTIAPQYAAGAVAYPVKSSMGTLAGDLIVAVANAGLNCQLFQATGVTAQTVQRANGAPWNSAGFPTLTTQEPCIPPVPVTPGSCAPANATGSFLVNMGQFIDRIYTADANQRLTLSQLNAQNMTRTVTELQGGIVMLKAFYGKDTDADGAVDTYDTVLPTNQAEWLQVISIRMAVVARSAQYEREEVSKTDPSWDVGASGAVVGAKPCGTSRCIVLSVDADPDWKHYRYRVFDTLVPLRNQRWKSRLPVAS